jgi:glucose-6-phosphate isomerase
LSPADIRQTESPGSIEPEYRAALSALEADDAVGRLVARDPGLWKADAATAPLIRDRLGWLDAPQWLRDRIPELKSFAAEVRGDGYTRVLLLGMGGSSLAPEVFERVGVAGPGAPTLEVLDSTDPTAIQSAEASARLDRTFFIVASKSGGTIETLSQYRYFRARVEALDLPHPGGRFAAITDAGSPLDRLATKDSFRRIFRNPADVGGRFSALTYFGMVPAALLGLDLDAIASRAVAARDESLASDAPENGALRLAAFLGAAARSGRNKLTLLTTPVLRPLGYWIEQLVAESTGKHGTGIIPVEGEPLGPAHHYGGDRVHFSVALQGEPDAELSRLEADLGRTGAPLVRVELPDRDAIAGEFYRWEVTTALLGSLLEINPFDEPNVQESKDNTRAILASIAKDGSLPPDEPRARSEGIEIYAPERVWTELQEGAPSMASLEMVLNRFLGLAGRGGYLAVLAYLERTAAAEASFSLLRRAVRNALHLPVLQGYGPRYLHSIGQLYKGGPPGGLFIEITTADPTDLAIPGEKFSFGQLKAAQALGDFAALERHERPVVRLHLTQGAEPGLRTVASAMERALAAMQSA